MSDVATHWIAIDETENDDVQYDDIESGYFFDEVIPIPIDRETCPTYRLTEIVGTAPGSVDEAIANGIAKAAESLHGLDWYEVVEIRGSIRDNKRTQTQVTMKVGFRVD